jgi:hypothetical protein
MLRNLVLLFAIQSTAIPILTQPNPDSTQLAITATTSTPTAPKAPSSYHEIKYDKRYYYPETLPDEEEIDALLREKSMREAGFVTSSPSSSPQNQNALHFSQKQLQQSLPHPGAPGSAHPSTNPSAHLRPDPRGTRYAVITYRWENSMTYWPPLLFFILMSAVVCLHTIVRGIRAKT